MRNRCSYAGLVSAYFSVYLAGTKNVSTNTIYSYRDTFVIFHGYLEKYCGLKLEKMLFNDLSRELILEFLQYLETERKYSISSRNQRLAVLKSFAKYVQIECPDEMILCQRILSIDSKKAAKPTVQSTKQILRWIHFFRRLHRIVSGILKQCILLRQAKISFIFVIFWGTNLLRQHRFTQKLIPKPGARH